MHLPHPARFRELSPWIALLGPVVIGCGGGGAGDSGRGTANEAASTPPAELGTYLTVVAPSVVAVDEPFTVRLRPVTQAGLPDYDFEGRYRIDVRGPGVKFPDPVTIEVTQEGVNVAAGIRLTEPGVQFLRCVVPGDSVEALANPINAVRDPEFRIYWGDLNGHSDLSSGSRGAGVFFWYAKSVSLLDFAALTDNGTWEDRALDDATFKEVTEYGIVDHEEPGRFVIVPAFEWSSPTYGHRLVYFREVPETLPTVAAGYDTPDKLRAALPADAILGVAHPSGASTAPATDPASVGGERLAEIYSALGSFEQPASHRPSTSETTGTFVSDLLNAGARIGFTASGDTRTTTPGNPRGMVLGDNRYPGGLTAVLATELTRDAVLEALRERRCYATTGLRYLLEFTVDGQQMGSEIRVAPGHTAEVYGALGSKTNWVRVEIVGPGGAIAVVTPEGDSSDVIEITATTDPVSAPTWLYLRGVDEFGGMAWSSPVFLLPE